MRNRKLVISLACIGLCGLTILSTDNSTSSLALEVDKWVNPIYLANETLDWIINYIPPNKGTPPPNTSTTDLGNLGECPVSVPPLVAMVYSEAEIEPGDYRLQTADEPTVKQYPTFWFYVPENKSDLTINLRVQGYENDQLLYEEDLVFLQENTGSIVGYQLPNSSGGFELNQSYLWKLKIECNEDTRPRSVSAVMKREELSLTQIEESTITAQDKIDILARNGFLHDTLTELAMLYEESPSEYQTTLDSLLQSAHMSLLTPVENIFIY